MTVPYPPTGGAGRSRHHLAEEGAGNALNLSRVRAHVEQAAGAGTGRQHEP